MKPKTVNESAFLERRKEKKLLQQGKRKAIDRLKKLIRRNRRRMEKRSKM